MTASQVTALLADLVDAYKTSNPNGAGCLDENTRVLYVEMLHDLDFEDSRAAIRDLIRTSKYFPTVAEIRDAVMARRTGFPEPEYAWAEVAMQLRKGGRDRRPLFFNVVTEAAVVVLGWRNLCNSDESSMPTHRAHFFRIYESLRKRINYAIESGDVQIGSATARQDALRAAGVRDAAVLVASGDGSPEALALPEGVAELRTITGKVLSRVNVYAGESKG